MTKFQLQDFVQFGQLFETYGALLSDDRQKIMAAYFEFNETLAEIAEERKISRQAVLDAIEKSCQKLQGFEDALGLCAKRQKLLEELTKIQQLTKFNAKDNERNICDALENISTKVENILKEI